MRRSTLVSIAATVVLTPGAAVAQFSGVVSAGGGVTHMVAAYSETESVTFYGPAAELLAIGSFDITPNLGVQGDLRYEFASFGNSPTGSYPRDFDAHLFDAGLHVYFRERDQFLIGAFAQKGATTRVDLESDSEYTEDRLYYGGEAQVYFDNLTLYGQAGRLDYTRDYTSYVMSGWFASVEMRYFLTEDFRIDGRVGVEFSDAYDGDDDDPFVTPQQGWSVGVGAEYQLADMPVSFFAKYDYFDFTWDSSEYSRDRHRLLFGVKFQFDDGTLMDRERNGVALKPVEHLSVVPNTSGS